MPKYTLKYFDVRARGELIRLLLASKDPDFAEERFTQESWPAEKPKARFGQLPVLVVDGKTQMTESLAIARYLAREYKMYGSTNMEGYRMDEILGICMDLFEKFVKVVFEKDEAKKAELEKALKGTQMPGYLKNINTLISANTAKGFSVGSTLSMADLAIFAVVDGRVSDGELNDFPGINAVLNSVRSNANIKQYLAKRKDTKF